MYILYVYTYLSINLSIHDTYTLTTPMCVIRTCVCKHTVHQQPMDVPNETRPQASSSSILLKNLWSLSFGV